MKPQRLHFTLAGVGGYSGRHRFATSGCGITSPQRGIDQLQKRSSCSVCGLEGQRSSDFLSSCWGVEKQNKGIVCSFVGHKLDELLCQAARSQKKQFGKECQALGKDLVIPGLQWDDGFADCGYAMLCFII